MTNIITNCKLLIEIFKKMIYFQAHVEAVVRVVGCVCDHDGSWTLDFDEVSGNDCQDLQYFIFGGTCDQDCFDATDANGDGFVDGHELAASLEGMDTAAGR